MVYIIRTLFYKVDYHCVIRMDVAMARKSGLIVPANIYNIIKLLRLLIYSHCTMHESPKVLD